MRGYLEIHIAGWWDGFESRLEARGASSLSLPLVEVTMKGQLGLIKPKPRTYFIGPPQFK